MVAIISEPRKDGYFRPLKDERLLEILYTVGNEISFIQYLEGEHEVTETTPFLELRLCTAMLAWSRGCSFDKLERYARVDPGDFVRTFRLVIDQLRQIRRAMSEHTALVDKLNGCIGKINRDVVDAERQLRIGQENLEDAATKDVGNAEGLQPATSEHTEGVVIENETPLS